MDTKNRQIGAAVLALGSMGKTHVDAAKTSPYIDKVIGYEPDPERARLCGKELGINVTSDFDSILRDPRVDLVLYSGAERGPLRTDCGSDASRQSGVVQKTDGDDPG